MGATELVRPRIKSRTEFFVRELLGEQGGHTLAWSERGSVVYAAIEKDNGRVTATVNIIHRRGDRWTYKIIGESEGPTEAKCPLRILRLLSKATNERARQWRRECYKQFKGVYHV